MSDAEPTIAVVEAPKPRLDAAALQRLVQERPEDVDKIAGEVSALLDTDSILVQSLEIMSFCRRLHTIALVAVDRRLKAGGCSDPDIGFRVLKEAHRAFKENGVFTVKDLEAACGSTLTDYFDLLAAGNMFQIAAPKELETVWEKLKKAAEETNVNLVQEKSPNRQQRRAQKSSQRKQKKRK